MMSPATEAEVMAIAIITVLLAAACAAGYGLWLLIG